MIHLTIQQLSSYVDGELVEASANLTRWHLASCQACAAKLSQLEVQKEALANALAIDPDEATLERLTQEIEELIRSPRSRPSPQHAAAAANGPAVPAGGGTAIAGADAPFGGGDIPVPGATTTIPMAPQWSPRGPSLGGRLFRAASWTAAAVIAVIVVSAGVTHVGLEWLAAEGDGRKASGTDSSQAGVGAIRPEVPAPVDAEGYARIEPAAAGETVLAKSSEAAEVASPKSNAASRPAPPKSKVTPAAAPSDAPAGDAAEALDSGFAPEPIRDDDALAAPLEGRSGPAGDPFAHLGAAARDAVQSAQRHSDEAVNDLSVEGFETAANDWERALPLLGGNAYLAACLGLAEARYHACQLAPSEDRAARARASIRAYLELAPSGPEREEAAGWLSRLEEAGFK